MQAQKVEAIFDLDDRIEYVREYLDGFVANSYRWPAPGTYNIYHRDGRSDTGTYDRKRRYGKGPKWVAYSSKHGCLVSG